MGCMFRSDEMTLCEMYVQPEVAYNVVNKLGQLGCVQFKDMSPETIPFQRPYASEVSRLNTLQSKLNYIKDEMIKNDVYMPPLQEVPEAMVPYELNEYENKLERSEQTIREMEAYQTKLLTNYRDLSEFHYVLTTIGPILGNVELNKDAMFTRDAALGDAFRVTLVVKTGVVERAKCRTFELMLWRISKGNIHFRTATKDKIFLNALTGEEVRMVAFIAVCQSEELGARMEKVCQGFHTHVYNLGRTRKERHDTVHKLETRLMDMEAVLKKTKYHRCKVLHALAKNWHIWRIKIKKSKAIYTTMNLFSLDYTRKCLIGQGWIPTTDVPSVNKVLNSCSEAVGLTVSSFLSAVVTKEVPPTYNRTNKFTYGFQSLIAAYGEAKYKEVNPGLYTIITFPFLFAIMFGDFGHGTIMTLFAAWMIKYEKKFMSQPSDNEIWSILFGGRYIIFLMGLFSMYTGFLYNDMFSRKFILMSSSWVINVTISRLEDSSVSKIELDPRAPSRRPYLFGVDPAWALASNVIMFDNSLKMKMAIILGVIHMIFGLLLSFVNYRFYHQNYAIILQFIPQMLFLCCLFLWLVTLIFIKWFKYNAKADELSLRPGCAPLILILFIDMMLRKKSETDDPNCEAYMFEGHKEIQDVFFFVSMGTIPIMLFGTPIYLHIAHSRKRRKKEEEEEEYSFSEIMIHQGIHTIEFVLSTVSHTASYLRLWALSLAHSQLSEMLWHMILVNLGIHDTSEKGGIVLFFVFGAWAVFTVSILVVMEGLSAFLHTLRLHWVEFMSKFFIGGGVLFVPFTFEWITLDE